MARAATARLKCNPPLGRMPVLQFVPPAELRIDATYQRSLETGPSQALIRRIAQHWNWDLCQPLVVARRAGSELFVIDGQHRLAASRLRSDIAQLPCVVVEYASAADEAASFVHLNQQRRPLGKLDLFKAAVASEDPEACAILAAMEAAGLSVAPHTNYTAWKPGMVQNIGGIEGAWRREGAVATAGAMRALALAWPKEVLRYAGTIFPGLVAICAAEFKKLGELPEGRVRRIAGVIGGRSQVDWRSAVAAERAADPDLKFGAASAKAMQAAWTVATGVPTPAPAVAAPAPAPVAPLRFKADDDGMCWCEQCDMRVTLAQAQGCRSRWCSLKARA